MWFDINYSHRVCDSVKFITERVLCATYALPFLVQSKDNMLSCYSATVWHAMLFVVERVSLRNITNKNPSTETFLNYCTHCLYSIHIICYLFYLFYLKMKNMVKLTFFIYLLNNCVFL